MKIALDVIIFMLVSPGLLDKTYLQKFNATKIPKKKDDKKFTIEVF